MKNHSKNWKQLTYFLARLLLLKSWKRLGNKTKIFRAEIHGNKQFLFMDSIPGKLSAWLRENRSNECHTHPFTFL